MNLNLDHGFVLLDSLLVLPLVKLHVSLLCQLEFSTKLKVVLLLVNNIWGVTLVKVNEGTATWPQVTGRLSLGSLL